jgi:nitrite reductase (NO-forming)
VEKISAPGEIFRTAGRKVSLNVATLRRRESCSGTVPMQIIRMMMIALLAMAATSGCARTFGEDDSTTTGGPLIGSGPPSIAAQVATCAGPREKTFTLGVQERRIDLGMGTHVEAWTYNGSMPGPVLEACEGDTVTIGVTNHAEASHGLDSMRCAPI